MMKAATLSARPARGGMVSPGIEPASILVTGRKPAWLGEWGRFARATAFDDLPAPVVARAKLVLLDCLGAIIAGKAEPEVAAAGKRLAKSAKARKAGSPLVDAFLGGTAGTMLEIDEGNQFARGHPGIHAVPAILATAKLRTVPGRDALTALVLGYEIGARIGIASKLNVGMHPHGTWGVVGAALAVAKLNRASRAEFMAAINLASSFGLTTSRKTMLEGATVRNAYAGASNMLGLIAWDLVKAGFTGEADGVGSVYGSIAASDFQPEEMTRELGARWEIARNYFKRHAACRYTHGALDALDAIAAKAGKALVPDAVKAIRVETYVWAAQLDHAAPQNMLAAKFSLPFALATRIVNGIADLAAFRTAARSDATTRALAARVSVAEDPAFTARLPAERPARVIVELTDGRRFEHMVASNRGDAEDPYPEADIIAKFHAVAGPVIGPARAGSIAAEVFSLERAGNLGALNGALA